MTASLADVTALDQLPVAQGTDAVMAKAASENFTVASRLVPPLLRTHLRAVYAYARAIDDIGDLAPGDRGAKLDWAEAELDRALAGAPAHPVFAQAAATAARVGMERAPFVALIEANRLDQVKHRYATYDELIGYCELSANPVGHLVLSVFGCNRPEMRRLSDLVCSALQLVEHFQDVAEDFSVGRIYLPTDDLERFGVAEEELAASTASDGLRRLMAFEAARARTLLHRGAPLVGMMSPAGRVAVAGFLGGGLAQLDALERAGYDVLSAPVKASKVSVARHALLALIESASPSGGGRRGR